jgi:hypothetical protein
MRPYLGYRTPSDGGFSDAWKKSVIGALLLSDKKTRDGRGRVIRT